MVPTLRSANLSSGASKPLSTQTDLFNAPAVVDRPRPPKGGFRPRDPRSKWVLRDWSDLGGPLFEGLDIPPNPMRGIGAEAAEIKAAWLEVVEHLLSHGWDRPHLIQKWGGPTATSWAKYANEIRQGWADAVKTPVRASRRERLYREARAVADECWRRLHDPERPPGHRDAAGLLRVVLDSNKRRAALIGADEGVEASTVNVVNVDASTKTINVIDAAMEKFGISREDLASAGSALGDALTARAYKQLEEIEE